MVPVGTTVQVVTVLPLPVSPCPVQKMKSEVNSSSSRSRGVLLGPSYGGRYAKMEHEMQRSNQDFLNRELQDQQVGETCWQGVEGLCLQHLKPFSVYVAPVVALH